MKTLLIVLAVALIGVPAALIQSSVRAENDEDERAEQEISLTDLPGPIRRALGNVKVGQVAEVERTTSDDGDPLYEIEFRVGNHEVELTLTPGGSLLNIEIEADDDDDEDGDGEDDQDDDDSRPEIGEKNDRGDS